MANIINQSEVRSWTVVVVEVQIWYFPNLKMQTTSDRLWSDFTCI